jgi:hypothetical protein
MLNRRLARLSEIVYAAIHGCLVYYILTRLSAVGHPPSQRTLILAWAPVAVALALAGVLGRPGRWVWWLATAFALYVVVDSAVAIFRIANLPTSTWPSNAWLAFSMIGLRLITQMLVAGAAVHALHQRSIAASPAA